MPLKATILRVESDVATLKTADDQEFRFPISEMDGIPAEGSEVLIAVAPLHATDSSSRPLARHLLHELLGQKPENT
jgi:hypothetical protein